MPLSGLIGLCRALRLLHYRVCRAVSSTFDCIKNDTILPLVRVDIILLCYKKVNMNIYTMHFYALVHLFTKYFFDFSQKPLDKKAKMWYNCRSQLCENFHNVVCACENFHKVFIFSFSFYQFQVANRPLCALSQLSNTCSKKKGRLPSPYHYCFITSSNTCQKL